MHDIFDKIPSTAIKIVFKNTWAVKLGLKCSSTCTFIDHGSIIPNILAPKETVLYKALSHIVMNGTHSHRLRWSGIHLRLPNIGLD